MNIFSLKKKYPQIGDDCYVAENAIVIGNVTIGNDSSVWFNVVIRGDDDAIFIGKETNIQDLSLLHTDPGFELIIGDNVTVGHRAVLHGCKIGNNCLIGIGAIVLNGAVIGDNCIIGANSLITKGKRIPDNSLVLGSPAQIVRQITPEEIEYIKWAAKHYVENIAEFNTSLAKK